MDLPPPSGPPLPPPSYMGPVESPRKKRVWWGIGDFFIAWIGGILCSTIAGSIYLVATGAVSDGEVRTDAGFLATALLSQSIGIVAVLAGIARWKGTGTLADFGWRWRIAPRDLWWVLVGAGLQLGFNLLLAPLTLLLPKDTSQGVVEALEGSFSFGLVVALVAVATLAPFSEEILYRGLLQRSLLRRFRPGRAVAISSIVFAVSHVIGDPSLGSLVALPALFGVGVVCGIRAVRTGSIAQSVCIHVGFNAWTAIALLVAALRG